MKSIKIIAISIIALLNVGVFSSCTGGGSSFETLNDDLRNKFGENAYYSTVSIVPNKTVGDIINVTITKDPSSLKMEEWARVSGSWSQTTDVTVEMEGGGSLENFVFQLTKEASIAKLGELIELSKKELTKEKSIENPALYMAVIECPENGGKEEMHYFVVLTPENGGTSFNYKYDLSGKLLDFNYH